MCALTAPGSSGMFHGPGTTSPFLQPGTTFPDSSTCERIPLSLRPAGMLWSGRGAPWVISLSHSKNDL